MNNEIKIYGQIGDGLLTARNIIDQIESIKKGGAKSITIRMHSEGGSVIDGNAIFNAILQSNIHIKVVIDGIAASMASVIILAANEVEICDNAFIMIHRPTMSESGDYDTFSQSAKVLQLIENNFLKCYSEKTGLSKEEIKTKWLDGKDHWFDANEAVQLGLANRTIASVAKGVTVDTEENLNSIYGKFKAKLNISNNINMKEELIKRFNLKGVDTDSSDSEVLDKLDEYFQTLKKDKDEVEEKVIENIVNEAINSNKIKASTKSVYLNIGKTSGLESLNAVFSAIPKFIPLASLIKPQVKGTFSSSNIQSKTDDKRYNMTEWGLDEYRKYAPQSLRDNPQLYKELCDKEHGNK